MALPIDTNTAESKPGISMYRSYLDKPFEVSRPWGLYKSGNFTKNSVVTAGYRAKVKKKSQLPDLPYFTSRTTTSHDWGFSRQFSPLYRYNYVPDDGNYYYTVALQNEMIGSVNRKSFNYDSKFFDATSIKAGVVSKAVAIAEQAASLSLLSKAKDQKANLVQTFAESKQLHTMITTFALTTANVIRDLRRGNLALAGQRVGVTIGARRSARYRRQYESAHTRAEVEQLLANGVLAVQYGVRPLISDVIGTAELFAQKVVREQRAKVQSRGSNTSTIEQKRFDPDQGLTETISYVVEIVCRKGARFGSSGGEVAHTLTQMGFSNPLLLAWELLPWSFVIDWVFPVGNYLSSLDATVGLDYYGGWNSVKTKETLTLQQTWDKSNGLSRSMGLVKFSETKESFSRSPAGNWPSASLPSFRNPVSLEHAINALALLAQVKKSVVR